MKKTILILVISFILFSCAKDKIQNDNPFIPDYPINYVIDLNLPKFGQLKFPSNSILIPDQNAGANGLIVVNTGSGYNAFDANCPNQYISSCPRMTLNGITATCPCDDLVYDLFSGTSPGQTYPMKFYSVEVSGNLIIITN